MNFELLLAHADTHRPVLEEGLPLDAASRQPRSETPRLPTHLYDHGGDPDSLPSQRWGVVVPKGSRGDDLLALIEPLYRLRGEQQGAKPRVYRAPPKLDAVQAWHWMDTELHVERVPREEQPRYLLVLGDFHEVPLELQQVLASDGFVGRLAFGSDSGYEAYVDKVLRWERNPLPARKAQALFYTAHDGSRATTVGYEVLVRRSLERCRELQEVGAFPAERILELGDPMDWPVQRMLEQVASPQASLLFTVSHGLGAPRGGWRSEQEQRALQGAMSLGRDGMLDASALASKPFLPGGLWFYLACFGAGTPARSAFYPWLERLHEAREYSGRAKRVLESLALEGERPFVAALPQAVLANPEGPLAVVGHVDLAWAYSFQDQHRGGQNHPSRFYGLLKSLVMGRRAGVGVGELFRAFHQANTELTILEEQEASGRGRPEYLARRAHLWMKRQDLAGYILLGDPAVNLPLTRQEQADQLQSPTERFAALLGLPVVAPAGAASARPSPEAMAQAVLDLIVGEKSPKAIAARVGVTLQELRQWEKAYKDAGLAAMAKLWS